MPDAPVAPQSINSILAAPANPDPAAAQPGPAAAPPTPAQMPQQIPVPPAPAAQPPAPTPPPQTPPPPAPAHDDEDDDYDDEDEAPRGRAHVRKLRRENRTLRERARDSDALRTRAESAETQLAQYQLAATHRISDPADIALIGSGTREEMEQRAARIGALVAAGHGTQAPAAAAPAPPPTNRPIESLRPGASPTPPSVPDTSYPTAWAPAQRRPSTH